MSCRVWVVWLLLASACTTKDKDRHEPQHIKELPAQEKLAPPAPARVAADRFKLEDYYNNAGLDKAAQTVFDGMPVQERAAQLIMPATGLFKDYGLPYATIVSLYRRSMIGGVLLLKGNITAFARQAAQLNQQAMAQKNVPLLFGMDGEPALIHRKLTDADSMLPASQQYSDAQVSNASQTVAQLLDRAGAHLNFAPVADRNGNTTIIDKRSYGADADSIVHKAGLFITQHRRAGKACVIKHFPGHGTVKGDSHDALVFIDGEPVELPVFARLLAEAQPAGVMMGHIAIKNNAWQTDGLPASLSPLMMKRLLRDSLHFKGLIFTDAMNMGAVAHLPGADFRALAAGADVVVMPQDVVVLHGRIVTAMRQGGSVGQQLEESALRVIKLKVCLGIIPGK